MNPAAIRAKYCNFINVPTRGQVKIVCEIPAEQADRVLEILGWPLPSNPKDVAICLLNEDAS